MVERENHTSQKGIWLPSKMCGLPAVEGQASPAMPFGSYSIRFCGATANPSVVRKLLLSFDARNNAGCEPFPAVVQPLQALACETALLAGADVDKNLILEAANSLLPFPRCECMPDRSVKKGVPDKKLSSDKSDALRCCCDDCLQWRVEQEDLRPCVSKDYSAEEMMLALDVGGQQPECTHSQEVMDILQLELFSQLLGDDLAEKVTLQFGTIINVDFVKFLGRADHPLCWKVDAVFLHIKGCFRNDCWEGGCRVGAKKVKTDHAKDNSPTGLEVWAFAKAVRLLGMKEDMFHCQVVPEHFVSHWHWCNWHGG